MMNLYDRMISLLSMRNPTSDESTNEEAYEEEKIDHQQEPLVTKNGFVTSKRNRKITVSVDDDDTPITFSLDDLKDVKYLPRQYDRVTLICCEDNVCDIAPTCQIQIGGKITMVQTDVQGVIDGKYIFYWDALSGNFALKQNDRVTADCVECELNDENEFRWRCVRVISDSQPIDSQPTIETMNRNGVEISDNIVVDFNGIHETKSFTMTVSNTFDEDVRILDSYFKNNKSESQLTLVSPRRKDQFALKSNQVKEYKFQATSKYFGHASEQFIINFERKSTGPFQITRFIKVSVHDTERKYRTIGTGPNVLNNYEYTKTIAMKDRSNVISAAQPTVNFVFQKFEEWPIPNALKVEVLRTNSCRSAILDTLQANYPHLNDTLTVGNYSKVFHDLLYLEECQMFHNMRKYDLQSRFTVRNELLALAVQNIAESRPSIVIGDYVIVSKLFAKDDHERKGWIEDVKQNEVLLKFDESFHKNYNNEEYKIEFYFSRKSLRKQHHAIELAARKLPAILFPDVIQPIEKQLDVTLNRNGELIQSNSTLLPWFNKSLNDVQKNAITNILQGIARPLPYVIFGPPGTGKTITLIETILQIIQNIKHSHVLVATPSNSAANLITKRIIDSGILEREQFVRVVSHNNVRRDMIPKEIIDYCGIISIARDGTVKQQAEESGLKTHCSAAHLKKFRLIIGTCITLGTLMQLEIADDHFSHVIVDECGQCMETELIVPLTRVDKDIGQIVLAGDPMQLGPIVFSHYAKRLGLSRSFLMRLMDRDVYKSDAQNVAHPYDPRLVTRLVYNYRSLPSIMSVYSDLFYNSTLKAVITADDSDEVKLLGKLSRFLPNDRNVNAGVIFIDVKGRNEKSNDSPSWYNDCEANSVAKYVRKFAACGQTANDIGIITPYLQQVKTIRSKLRNENCLIEPKIGTVEEFQGQERKIILLSTVRTTRENLHLDEKYSLGFIGHPNRMNVAISRARALLVIFGSAELLSNDTNWQYLINYCVENKCFLSGETNPFVVKNQKFPHHRRM